MTEKFYSVQNTPNTVSADRDPSERSFLGTVIQSGKPIVDYELQLLWDIQKSLKEQIRRVQLPSGILKGQNHKDSYTDYSFDLPGDPGFVANSFHIAKQVAMVAGFPVTLEYTNTAVEGDNLIQLDAPPILGGLAPDVKRTDFVFLEVWLALVGPSPRAQGTITVDPALPAPGDTVTINGNVLTAVAGPPGVDQFEIGANETITASNIAAAINDGANSFSGDVAASASGAVVTLTAQTPGAAGNAITLATSVPLVLIISGGLLAGGADRPNKPTQDTLYRHGNTQADSSVNLPDDLADPVIVSETAQRIQIQYRFRVTGQAEAVNFKSQPDGFSCGVLAQGGAGAPVANYPFVPADNASVQGNSDATAYGVVDSGLWIAGNATSTSATDLQTLDGLLYAIPICYVFRRNDAYNGGAGGGFDPLNNTNGALPSTHPGFVNPAVGAIAAGDSDRPDNALVDVVNGNDILDLRHHVSSLGQDLRPQLQFQMQSLLDGNFRTWAIDTSDKQTLGGGSGDISTRFLVANEIGRDGGHGGNGLTSGDTNRGVTVRNFDHVARRFGDQSVVERVVFGIQPQDRQVGPAPAPGIVNPGLYVERAPAAGTDLGWFEGDIIHLDLTALNASTDGTFDPSTASLAAILENILDFSPPGTIISDVLSIYHDDGNYSLAVNQQAQPSTIVGLGTGHVEITLDANPTIVSGGEVAAVASTGSITIASEPSPGDTVTMNGTVLTAVAGPAGANQFTLGGDPFSTAANLGGAINTYVGATFVAVVVGNVINLTAATPGAAGDLLTLATSNAVDIVLSGGNLTGGLDGVVAYPLVGNTTDGDIGSPRRIFVELEVSYPKGSGLTDTPDEVLVPDPNSYDFGPMVENDVSQRPADMEDPLPPKFREGFREVALEYIASENGAGTPIGGITTEQFVSRNTTDIVFLRRLYGSFALAINVTDVPALAPVPVNTGTTEYGSSSRLLKTGAGLSGAQTLCTVTYFAQDAIPNYGGAGGGYQLTVYYRSNAPQTVGTKAGVIHGGTGSLPTELVVEPLLMDEKLWTGHTGVGSVDLPYPYAVPLDQIPVNDDNTGTFPGEWYFCASAQISIDDFNADVGLLTLPNFVMVDGTAEFSFGGPSGPPDKDIEFRAFYPFADDTAYRPTVMAQPLTGAVRHKVFTPFLARATADTLLFRRNEVLLIVLTRWAELDDQNVVRFTDTNNRTCAAVYRTKNLLLIAGD